VLRGATAWIAAMVESPHNCRGPRYKTSISC